jgi:hypothetical protein
MKSLRFQLVLESDRLIPLGRRIMGVKKKGETG